MCVCVPGDASCTLPWSTVSLKKIPDWRDKNRVSPCVQVHLCLLGCSAFSTVLSQKKQTIGRTWKGREIPHYIRPKFVFQPLL